MNPALEPQERKAKKMRAYLADAKAEERSALRWLLVDLGLELAGEGTYWPTVLVEAVVASVDLLVIDLALLPEPASPALALFRSACPAAKIVLLADREMACRQADLAEAADIFISKDDPAEQVAERLRLAAS